MASASAPPTSAINRIAMSSEKLISPTTSDDRVSSYVWKGIATYVIMVPAVETPWPKNSSRKSRDARNGDVSSAIDRNVRRMVERRVPASSTLTETSACGSGVARVCGGVSSAMTWRCLQRRVSAWLSDDRVASRAS